LLYTVVSNTYISNKERGVEIQCGHKIYYSHMASTAGIAFSHPAWHVTTVASPTKL
jgi:hypothetical protein